LTLVQSAEGGTGGISYGGNSVGVGGSATSSLVVDTANTGGGNLVLNSVAYGGSGGSSQYSPAQATDGALAQNTVTGTSSLANLTLTVSGFASGGGGGYDLEGGVLGVAGAGAQGTSQSTAIATGQNTNVVVTDVADGGGGGSSYGDYGGFGFGTDGTSASSTAAGSAASGSGVISASATGGSGGEGSGSGYAGGNGVTAIATASGTSSNGGNLTISATVNGGSGGYGSYGANGGIGASVDIENVVSGSTTGTLTLNQNAQAGSGGDSDSDYSGYAGNGGSAMSKLTYTDNSGPLTASASAIGGDGGNDSFNGAYAGSADAETYLTGIGTVNASASATGGNDQYGNGSATAIAQATVTNVGGIAIANATSSGSSNGGASAQAIATSGTGFVQAVSAVAAAPNSVNYYLPNGQLANPGPAQAMAGLTTPVFSTTLPSGIQAVAYGTGAPAAGDVAAALSGNPNTVTAFASTPGLQAVGLGLLGSTNVNGNFGSATSTLDFTLNNSTPIQDIQLALLNPVFPTAGYDYYYLSVNKVGGADDFWSFNSLAATKAFFSDNVIDLGGALSGSTQDIQVTLVVGTGTIGQGLGANLILGASVTGPAPSSTVIGNNETVDISNDSQLDPGGVTLAGGTLNFFGGSSTLSRDITASTGGTIINTGGGDLTLSGTLTKANSVLTLGGGSFIVTGQITGGTTNDFNSDLVINNASSVTLDNSNNNYTGPTYVYGGSTLINGIDNALPTGTVLNLGNSSDGAVTNTYDLNGYNQSIAALNSVNNNSQTNVNVVTNNGASGTSTLTLTGIDADNNPQNSSYYGLIQDGTNAQTALAITGGTHTLGGANTYSGGTTISGGTLLANGSNSTGSGAVTVSTGGTLGGTGTIIPSNAGPGVAISIAAGGTLSPSAGTGIATTLTLALQSNQSMNLLSGAKFAFDLGATGASDQVDVTGGTLTLNSQNFSDFSFTTLSGFGTGAYDLFVTDGSGDITGSLGTTTGSIGAYTGTLSVLNSQYLVLTVTPGAIPEPTTWAMMLLGIAVLAVWRPSARSKMRRS
jgi:hypothetical protein